MYKAVKKESFLQDKKGYIEIASFVNFGGLFLNAENVINETFLSKFQTRWK